MLKIIKYPQKWAIVCFFVFLFVSCKTNRVITGGELNTNLSSKAIVKAHYNNQLNFKTLVGKMKIDYSDGDNSKGISVSLRMEKDKAIWISAPLGIVKAYITPDRVTFYNKLEKNYFDGNFSYLSNLLGTELDFNKVQNVLMGQAIFNLKEEKYTTTIAEKKYQLKPKNAGVLFKTLFQIEPKNFKIAMQQIAQPLKKRLLKIEYKDYQIVQNSIIPNDIEIEALDSGDKKNIAITYKNIELNKPLRFPYKIPKGFKKIALK